MIVSIVTPLQEYLQDTGTTETWIAKKLGVSRATVSRWTHGDRISLRYRNMLKQILRERSEIDTDMMVDELEHLPSRTAIRTPIRTPYDRLVNAR